MNKIKKNLLIPLTLHILIASSAYGYDPQQHRDITEQSTRLVRQLGIELTQQEINWLKDGSSGEDTNVGLILPRIFNWHFFPDSYYPTEETAYQGRPQNWRAINYHAERRINQIITKLNIDIETAITLRRTNPACALDSIHTRDHTECGLRPVFDSLGRLLHFDQDASVPAHVAPNYHGPFLPCFSGGVRCRGVKLADPIDSAPVRDIVETLTVQVPGEELSFPDLIRSSIRGTLRIMRSPIVEDQSSPLAGLAWNHFFGEPVPGEFFGRFAVDRNGKQLFDPRTRKATAQLFFGAYEIPQASIDTFIRRIHSQAIHSSAVLINRAWKDLSRLDSLESRDVKPHRFLSGLRDLFDKLAYISEDMLEERILY